MCVIKQNALFEIVFKAWDETIESELPIYRERERERESKSVFTTV